MFGNNLCAKLTRSLHNHAIPWLSECSPSHGRPPQCSHPDDWFHRRSNTRKLGPRTGQGCPETVVTQNVAPHVVGPHPVATQMIGSKEGKSQEKRDRELVRVALRL